MASLREVHDALADQLEANVDGLRVHGYPPQGATPPVAFVALDDLDYLAMGRQGWLEYRLQVFVFTANTVRSQDGYRSLMTFADSSGSKSVPLAIWDGNDRAAGTFNGLADTQIHVQGLSVLGIEDFDAYQMYGGVFTVIVKTKADGT